MLTDFYNIWHRVYEEDFSQSNDRWMGTHPHFWCEPGLLAKSAAGDDGCSCTSEWRLALGVADIMLT